MFHERVSQHLAPCLAQFAAAAGDESYWKAINHHVCLKTRHSSSQVCVCESYSSAVHNVKPHLTQAFCDRLFKCCKISEVLNVFEL